MGYPTDTAKWPTAIPTSVVQLYDRLFSLTDFKSEAAGDHLADEVFSQDGIFIGPSGVFEGHEALRTCRKGVWDTIVSRHHEVRKVFVCDADKDKLELILAGAVDVETPDGKKHAHEFLVRSVVVQLGDSSPRVKHYQVLIPTPKNAHPILG